MRPSLPRPAAAPGRLAWFAAAAFVVLFGAGELVRWTLESLRGPSWWALDLGLLLGAAGRLATGADAYADPRFLYPPAAVLAARPLAVLDPAAVSVAWAAAKVALVLAGVAALGRGRSRGTLVLAAAAVLGSLPLLHDLFLGNVNTLLVAAAVPAVAGADRRRSGLALGVAGALFAKPLLLPLGLWLLVHRRRTAAGAVLAGLAVTGAALVLAGPAAHAAWLGALLGGTRFAAPFAGNHGVTALAPALWPPVALATAAGLGWVLARRGPDAGLAWAAASGILLAPYAGTYAALPLALAVPWLGARRPWLVLGLVAASPVLATHPLPFLAAAVLLAALRTAEGRPGARADTAPDRDGAATRARAPA